MVTVWFGTIIGGFMLGVYIICLRGGFGMNLTAYLDLGFGSMAYYRLRLWMWMWMDGSVASLDIDLMSEMSAIEPLTLHT